MKDPYLPLETVNQSTKRIILLLLVISFFLISFFSGTQLMDTYREYKAFRVQENQNEKHIADARVQLKKRELYMDKLTSDKELIEHVARERLQYSRDGDIVFHFKNEQTN